MGQHRVEQMMMQDTWTAPTNPPPTDMNTKQYHYHHNRRRNTATHNLPWYLENSAMSRNEKDSVILRTTVELSKGNQGGQVSTSNISPPTSPTNEEEQVIIRHYTGDFGVSFKYDNHKDDFETNQDVSTFTESLSHNNPSCSHCYRQTRRQKRARWESNNLFQSNIMGTENVIEFTPFQGSVLDLVKNTQTLSTSQYDESSRTQGMVIIFWSSIMMYFIQAITVFCLILILNLLFKKKKILSSFMEGFLLAMNRKYPKMNDSHPRTSVGEHIPPQQQSIEQQNYQSIEQKRQSVEQDSHSLEKMTLSNSDSEPEDLDVFNSHGHCSPISNSSVFSVAIPAMADIISKSGLNRQDSLRIATEQVLSAQRREYEKMQEEKKEKLKRMKEITKMEITRLEKCIVSTMIGYNMIFCIAIGCATRAIANNFHAMHYLFVKQNVHDVITNFCLLDAIYKWFVKDICECSESSYSMTYSQSEVNPLSRHPTTASHCSYGGMLYVLNHIGMASFVSFLFSMSLPIARCMIGCMIKIVLVGLSHRILAVFHSKSLHQCLNLFVFLSLVLRTAAGKTAIELIPAIIGFNFICCTVAFYYRVGEPTLLRDEKSQDGTMILEDYERTICRTSNRTKLLRLFTCLGSIIMGTTFKS